MATNRQNVGHHANRESAMTNFVAALVQAEAAMEIFRKQNAGQLVMISSMSAMRGMRKGMTTYAASKAGAAHLAEGLRNEMHGKPVNVTVLYPGYIASEMNDGVTQKTPLIVSTETGVRAMVDPIEKEKDPACVPPLPWAPPEPADQALPAAGVQEADVSTVGPDASHP
jgi:short-subunit dehydrogenase